MSENEAPLAAALVPRQSADAWVVSQLASAPLQKQSFFRYGNSLCSLEISLPRQTGTKRGKMGPSLPFSPPLSPPGFSGLLVIGRCCLPLLPLRGVVGGFSVTLWLPPVLLGRNGTFLVSHPVFFHPSWMWVHGTREVLRCSGSSGEGRGRAVCVREAAGFGGATAPGALDCAVPQEDLASKYRE